MALYSNGQHRTALGCTSFDSAGVHCARHCTPDWNTLHYTSVGGTGLDWTGQDSTSRNWIVAVLFYGIEVFQMEIHCIELAWMGLHLSGRNWTGVSGTRLHWTREHCTSLHCVAIDCAWLHQIALHCTVLVWTGNILSIVCIELDWTWKDYSGLPKLQWS